MGSRDRHFVTDGSAAMQQCRAKRRRPDSLSGSRRAGDPGLHPAGCLSSTFGNSAPKTKTLVNRLDRGVYEVSRRPQDTAPKDDRGPVVRTVETAQTFLTAAEVDALVGDYLAGMSVKALAERYGIHRATVFAHLRRRNVPSRRPGLGIDEKAEAVRLARAGVSMRAIGRRMGVDRKAVRAALVEAGLIVDEASDDS